MRILNPKTTIIASAVSVSTCLTAAANAPVSITSRRQRLPTAKADERFPNHRDERLVSDRRRFQPTRKIHRTALTFAVSRLSF